MLKTSILITLIGFLLQYELVRSAAVSVASSGDPPSNQANGMSYNGRNNVPSQYNSNSNGAGYRGSSQFDTPPSAMRFAPSATGFGFGYQQPGQFNTPTNYHQYPYNSYGTVPQYVSYYGQSNQFPATGMNPNLNSGLNPAGLSPFANQPGMPPYHQTFGQHPSFGQSPQFGQSSQLPTSPDGQMPPIFNRNNLSKPDEKSNKSSQ